MKRFIKEDTYHIVYENLHEFFTQTNPATPPPTTNRNNQSEVDDMSHESSWRYGDEKQKDNFYHIRFDPSKGKKMCAEAVKKTMADGTYKKLVRQAMTYRKRIKFEDHGFRMNVSKAISGEDRYFGVYKNARKPIVKIAINICGSACVGQEQFRKVAETAIPTIYALETAGIATEVYYTAFVDGCHRDEKGNTIPHTITHVKIKSAEERFNWTTFAPVFCLGSYRESIFMSWIGSQYETNGGLGKPMPDYRIESHNNYGYTSVIGLNGVGPVTVINQDFEKIGKKEC